MDIRLKLMVGAAALAPLIGLYLIAKSAPTWRSWARALVVLSLCLAGSVVCEMAFLFLAFGAKLRAPFILMSSPIAIGSALLVFPLVHFALLRRRLLTGFGFILSSVLAEIVIVTPLFFPAGFFGAYFVLLMSLRFVHGSAWELFQPQSPVGADHP